MTPFKQEFSPMYISYDRGITSYWKVNGGCTSALWISMTIAALALISSLVFKT